MVGFVAMAAEALLIFSRPSEVVVVAVAAAAVAQALASGTCCIP